MKQVNWNNLRETPIGHLVALFRALEYNQHVTEVNIGKTDLFEFTVEDQIMKPRIFAKNK